jgi:hypothetical protein
MICLTAAGQVPNNPTRKVTALVGWSALVLLITSAVALATLASLQHFGVIHISHLVLYLPCAAGGGASALVGLVALCIYQCSRPQQAQANPDKLSSENEAAVAQEHTAPKVAKKESPKTEVDKWIEKTHPKRVLHQREEPKLGELTSFQFHHKPGLQQLKAPPNALACFLVTAGEFMGLEDGNSSFNSLLSLSFMIQHLEEYQQKRTGGPTELLEKFIGRLQIAYRFIQYTKQLERPSSAETYIQGRGEFVKQIFETLEQEKSVLLHGGYRASPVGHFILLELCLHEGMVRGRLFNTGKSISHYHPAQEGIKVRYQPLLLSPVPLESLKQICLLERLVDLQVTDLLPAETKWGVEIRTHYTSNDIYEMLIPLWPGEVLSEENTSYLPQNGGSCAFKPFLILMKEALGKKCEGELAQIYLYTASLRGLLETHINFHQIHLNFLEDALVDLHKKGVKLDRAGSLPDWLKQDLLTLADAIQKKINAERQVRKKKEELNNPHLEEQTIDSDDTEITLRPCRPMEMKSQSAQREAPQEKLSGDSPATLLLSALNLAQQAMTNHQLKRAVMIAQDALFRLPNPLDACWQKSPLNGEQIHILFELAFLFLRENSTRKEGMTVSTHVAILMLKVVTLALHHAELHQVAPDVIEMYGGKLNSALEQTGYLYQATHPTYAKTWIDCKQFLSTYRTGVAPVTLTKRRQAVDNELVLVATAFTSLSDLRDKDVELCFLNDFLQLHPELKGTPLLLYPCTGHSFGDTLELHQDRSLFFKDEKPCAYQSSNPVYEPIRSWISLRRLYHCFLLSAFVVGRADAPSASHVYFKFDTGHVGLGEIGSRLDTVEYFLVQSPQELIQNLFLETDRILSEEMKEQLWKFYKPANQTHQNAHLLHQMMLHWDQQLDLSPQEYQYLLSIQLYDTFRISQLIGFFTQYFHRLKDPRLQTLFSHELFSLNRQHSEFLLNEVVRSPSGVKEQLIEFLKVALKKSQMVGWVDTHYFLIRVLGQVIRYLAAGDPNSTLFKKSVELWKEKSLALMNTLPAPAQGVAVVVACAPYFDLPELHPLFEICQQACKQLDNLNEKVEVEKQPQLAQDLTLGRVLLQSDGYPPQRLPQWIIDHDDYFLIQHFQVTAIHPTLYEFYDAQGECYRLAAEHPHIWIYKKINQKWYQLHTTPPFQGSGVAPPCKEGYLTQDVRFWSALEGGESLVFSNQTQQLLCRVTPQGIFHPTQGEWMLSTNYQTPLIQHLGRLSSPKEILVWKNNKQASLCIEIPKLELQFTYIEGKWRSSLHPGYFLDTQAYTSILEPHSHYVVLRNKKGKRIAIMLELGCIAKKHALEESKIEYKELTVKPILVTVHLTKQGGMKLPENREHALYIIYLALRKGDYKSAAHLIKLLKKEGGELPPQSCIWIEDLDPPEEWAERSDVHPEAVACRLQLRLLMKKSTLEVKTKTRIGWINDYFDYLRQHQRTSSAHLSKQEELKTIKWFQKFGGLLDREKYRIALREHELIASDLPLPLSEKEPIWPPFAQERSFSFIWIDPQIEAKMKEGMYHPSPVRLDTRPGSALIDNFLYYYCIAKHLPEDHPLRVQLSKLLQVSRWISDVKLLSLHTALVNVLMEPDTFPTLDVLCQRPLKESMDQWKLTQKSLPEWQFRSKQGERMVRCSPSLGVSLTPTAPPSYKPSHEKYEIQSGGVDLMQQLKDQDFLVLQNASEFKAQIQHDLNSLQEMAAFISTCKDPNPCIMKEFDRLQEGFRIKKQTLLEQKNPPYLLKCRSLNNLVQTLQDLEKRYHTLIEEKKEAILKIAHTYPETLALEKNGQMLLPLTLHELIVYYGTGCEEKIYASNPSIDPEKMGELKTFIGAYLILSTDHQQIVDLKKDLAPIERYIGEKGEDSTEVKTLSAEFVKKAQAQRVYDISTEPHLLVFEFFGKIRLRKDQYEALKLMTGTEKDLELEARTGFGKSKVLIPLWLFLKGLHDKLVMMTVPSSLFIAQHRHLRKVLGKAYDASIVPLQFNRSKANDVHYLKSIYKKLQDAKQHHKIVLTTLQSLHGMTNLKIKEALAEGVEKADLLAIDRLMQLRTLIQQETADFFDESKVCFQLRQRYDYAIGIAQPIHRDLIQSTISLYREVILQAPFHFEFLPYRASTSQPLPLPEEYETKLLPHLAEQAMKQFPIPTPLTKIISEDLQGRYTAACEEFYQCLSLPQLVAYQRIKKQLTIHMRRTLFRKCEDHYGFYPHTRVAIPYVDGTPKLTSEFSEVEDSIDFTIQLNIKKPLYAADLELWIDRLKMQFLGGEAFEHVLTWIQRVARCSLLEIDEKKCQTIAEQLNENIELKLEYIELAILPKIKVYNERITSTSFNMIRAIHHVQAASGTVDPDILPPRLETHEDKSAVVENLMALWKHSQDAILKIPAKNLHNQPLDSPSKQLTWLLTHQPEANVLIDVAGTYLDLSMAIDTILTARPQILGVVYHDDEGREMVYERSTKMALPKEESLLTTEMLFVFFRKSKVIGTDTEMDLAAKAIVMVDRETWYTLLIQGTGRMRKLTGCQRVCYAIVEEETNYVFGNKTLQFKHLLEYSLRTQGRQKGEDNAYTLRLYLEDLIDSRFWQAAAHLEQKERLDLFEKLRPVLVKSTQTNGSQQKRERKKMPQEQAVEKIKSEGFAPLEQFLEKNPQWSQVFDLERMRQEFDQFVDYNKLPKEMDMYGDHETHLDVDATHDQEEIQEEVHEATNEGITEQELENFTDQMTELPKVHFRPAEPLEWEGDCLAMFAKNPSMTLLGVPLYFSPNFRRISLVERENTQIQKPAYQCLIQKDRYGNPQLLLLDLHDADIVFKKLLSASYPKHVNFYLLSGRSVIAQQNTKPLSSDEEGMRPIHIICKLFRASPLNQKEQDYLRMLSAQQLKEFSHHVQQLQKVWPHLASFTAQIPTSF